MRQCKSLLLIVIAVILTALPQGSVAQDGTSDAELQAHTIYDSVLSPFCPGKLLRDCPSSAASTLKQDILKKIESGKTVNEVTTELYAVYGDEISAVPRKSGFGLVAWIGPFAFIFIGITAGLIWLRSKQTSAMQQNVSTVPTHHLSEKERSEIESLMSDD